MRRARRHCLDLHGTAELRPEPPAFEWVTVPANSAITLSVWRNATTCRRWKAASTLAASATPRRVTQRPTPSRFKGSDYHLSDRKPRFEVKIDRRSEYGGTAKCGDDKWLAHHAVDHALYTIVPPYGDNPLHGHAWVPIDDENCFAWTFSYHPGRPLSEVELEVMHEGGSLHVNQDPGTFRPVANRDNDYLMDRAARKQAHHPVELKASRCGMRRPRKHGPRRRPFRENLVLTDRGIALARRQLLRAAEELGRGTPPPGLDPEAQAVRSASFELDRDIPFDEAPGEPTKVKEGVAHTSI